MHIKRGWRSRLRNISLLGFRKVPVYIIVRHFAEGMKAGQLSNRASAVAFRVFLALFPALIALISMLPYFNAEEMSVLVFDFLNYFFPDNVAEGFNNSVLEMLSYDSNRGLFWISISIAVIFVINGMKSLIVSFNQSYHIKEKRTLPKIYLISMFLILIFIVLFLLAFALIIFGGWMKTYLSARGLLENDSYLFVFQTLRWLIIIFVFTVAISLLYYIGPDTRAKYKLMSPGIFVAGFVSILSTVAFDFYVDNFSKYNVLYGSIGVIIVIMLLFYFNAFSLILGFEVDACLNTALKERKEMEIGKINEEDEFF